MTHSSSSESVEGLAAPSATELELAVGYKYDEQGECYKKEIDINSFRPIF